ncbi:MAG: hypothetical protein HY438_03670, partial [DPANN group archaeon]|nr:hypothetical protein [DPANN group archaeon]
MGVSEVITRKVGMNLATKLILLLVATLSFSAVLAMQPITIPMEIRNSTGGIANDTSFDINFTFYDRPTGGVLLFNQTQTLTTDRFGRIFAIVNTTGFNGTAPVWLELNVSNITMSPRMQLTAALFAINSERLQ